MMTIRRFRKTDDEYRAVLDISNTLWPEEKQGLAEFKYEDDSRDPSYTHARFVGEMDGKIVASGVYSHCNWSHVDGKYIVFVEVHPDHHKQGYGQQFYDFLEAHFIAIVDGRFVGVTSLWRSLAEKDKLHTALTGVVRGLRRKGIATALKVRAVEFARDQEARVIRTENEENNPMYDLNVRLGFRPVPAWWTYRKELEHLNGDTPT